MCGLSEVQGRPFSSDKSVAREYKQKRGNGQTGQPREVAQVSINKKPRAMLTAVDRFKLSGLATENHPRPEREEWGAVGDCRPDQDLAYSRF